MPLTSPESPTGNFFHNSLQVLLPTLLIASMFMAVAFASRSAADSETRFIEKTLSARKATPENLREEISLHDGIMEASPIKANLTAATESGLIKLSNPEEAAELERVAIEIDLAGVNEADLSASKLPLELLELLSRRASPLQLEITLRVAPANVNIAMRWFDAVRQNAEPGQIVDVSRIAVSLDRSIPLDRLRMDVLRTKKIVMTKESDNE